MQIGNLYILFSFYVCISPCNFRLDYVDVSIYIDIDHDSAPKNLSPRVGKSCRLPCNARALYASHHQVHNSPLPQGSSVLARTQSSRVVSLFCCLPRKPCAAARDRRTGPSPESYSVSEPVLCIPCFAVVWRTTGPSLICCCSSL
jgi:hypothetical protein